MKNHKVSVVIPCYQAERFIERTLDSVLTQSAAPFEVIVVDDGSSDGSAQIAESFGSPVKVIRQSNQGECAARNSALAKVTGEWVAFIDADDIWHPRKLEHQLAMADSSSDCHVVYCAYTIFNTPAPAWDCDLGLCDPQPSLSDLFLTSPINMVTGIVRRKTLGATRFADGVTNSGDMLFWLDIRRKCTFHFVPKVLAAYRQHPGQISRSKLGLLRSVSARLKWLKANSSSFSEAEVLRLEETLLDELRLAMEQCYWDRDTKTLRQIARQLARMRPSITSNSIYRRRWLPSWLLKLRDSLSATVAPTKRAAAQGVPGIFFPDGKKPELPHPAR